MKNFDKDIDQGMDKTKDNLISQFNEILDGAERLLKETAESADSKTSELREQLTDKIRSVKESLGEHAKPLCKKSREALEVANDYVNQHPWVAIGIASASVFILSHLRRR